MWRSKDTEKKITLATQVTNGRWPPSEIRTSVEASLRCLQTDVADVIQFHRSWYPREHVDLILKGGSLEAFQRLRDEGRVRFL